MNVLFAVLIARRIDDVELPIEYPKKSFIVGALEKEIRLSFAMRIRKTLPEPYQALLSEAKDKDVPDFKYADDGRFDTRILIRKIWLINA